MKEIYEFWMRNQVFFYAISAVFVLGILADMVLVWHYKKTVSKMYSSGKKNRLLKKIEDETERIKNVDDKNVYNVDNFVDKCLYADKIAGIRAFVWEKIGWMMLITCGMLLFSAGICGYMFQEDINKILRIYMVGIAGYFVFFLFWNLLCVKDQRVFFRNSIKSYCMERLLENKNEEVEEKQAEFMEGTEVRADKKKRADRKAQASVRVPEWKAAGQMDLNEGKKEKQQEAKMISDALKKQVQELVEEGQLKEISSKLQSEARKENEQNKVPDPMNATWNLEDVIAATEEKMRQQKKTEGIENRKTEENEKTQPGGIKLRPEDEKVIMDILKEYL